MKATDKSVDKVRVLLILLAMEEEEKIRDGVGKNCIIVSLFYDIFRERVRRKQIRKMRADRLTDEITYPLVLSNFVNNENGKKKVVNLFPN